MMGERDPRLGVRVTRVVRVPPAAALLLAVPVLLALGVASVVVFVVAAVALIAAPLRRGIGRGTRASREDDDAIVLDPSAFRAVADPAEPLAPRPVISSRDAPTSSRLRAIRRGLRGRRREASP